MIKLTLGQAAKMLEELNQLIIKIHCFGTRDLIARECIAHRIHKVLPIESYDSDVPLVLGYFDCGNCGARFIKKHKDREENFCPECGISEFENPDSRLYELVEFYPELAALEV